MTCTWQLRYLVGLTVRSVFFDRLLLAFIVLSTGLLSYETYPSAVGATRATLDMLNLVCRSAPAPSARLTACACLSVCVSACACLCVCVCLCVSVSQPRVQVCPAPTRPHSTAPTSPRRVPRMRCGRALCASIRAPGRACPRSRTVGAARIIGRRDSCTG